MQFSDKRLAELIVTRGAEILLSSIAELKSDLAKPALE
jgi:hypothetical protein